MNLKEFTKKLPMPEAPILFEHLKPLPQPEVGLAVLGCPIQHSISPQIHGAALKVLSGQDSKFSSWHYQKIEVHPQSLAHALPILADFGFRGLNLTIPHKVDVLPLLSSVEDRARTMGAVNTLSWEKEGWRGYNTDGVGLSRAIEVEFNRPLRDFNVLVLGAGGAARAAVAQSILDGCGQVAVYNRSLDRAKQLYDALINYDLKHDLLVLESFLNPFADSNLPLLMINATSVGLRKGDPPPVDITRIKGNVYLYDMVYNPPVTPLMLAGIERGYPVANGLGMLVGQAARSLEIWSGRDVSLSAMKQAAESAIS
jgi:shikimate dehydrogenase